MLTYYYLMSITDVNIYYASVLNVNEIAKLISDKCDINDKLNIVAKYKNIEQLCASLFENGHFKCYLKML